MKNQYISPQMLHNVNNEFVFHMKIDISDNEHTLYIQCYGE